MTKTNSSGENTYLLTSTSVKCQNLSCEKAIQKISMRELAAGCAHIASHHSCICHWVIFDFLSRISDRWPWINCIVQATCLTSIHFLDPYKCATCSSLLSENICEIAGLSLPAGGDRMVHLLWAIFFHNYGWLCHPLRVYSSVVHRGNWPNIRCIFAMAFTKNSNP